MNHKYTLKNRGHGEWAIFAPGEEDKKPVISLSCNRWVAQEIIDSLDRGKGVPADLVWAIKKGKENKS